MSSATTNFTQRISDFATATTFDDIPPLVRHECKRLLLDTVGCALGGAGTESGRIALEYVRQLGGSPDATVIGSAARSSAPNAAYVNGRLANVLDADDTFPTPTHFGNSTISAALALGERLGRSGRDLVTAIAVGFDIGARIGSWMGTPFEIQDGKLVGWSERGGPAATVTLAAVGAAVSIGHLDPLQANHAFGLAAANTPQPTIRRWAEAEIQPMFKYTDAGWCAQTGVSAAMLASLGSTGFLDILDGENAFWRFYGSTSHNDAELICELGTKWRILDTTYKPWPCVRWSHYALTALVGLVREHGLAPDEIDRVIVRTNRFAVSRIFCEQQPGDALSAEFSHPHAVAAVAYGVPPGPQWFAPEVLHAPHIQAFRAKVFVELEATSDDVAKWMNGGEWRAFPGGIDVFARGEVFSATCHYALGDPWTGATRLSDQDLIDKFRAMVLTDDGAAIPVEHARRVDACIEAILEVDNCDDISHLTRHISNLISPEH